MREDLLYVVYRHTNLITGESYIGTTSQPLYKRSQKNGNGYVESPLFYEAIQKYGWENFSHSILASGLTREEAGNMERHFIHLYKTNTHGYNMQSGGFKDITISEKTKQKISKSLKGRVFSPEHRRNMSLAELGEKNHEYGKKWSEERRKVASEQRRNVQYPGKRYVAQCDLDGNVLRIWNGISHASRSIGISYSCISCCCTGKQLTAKGFKWRYATKEEYQKWEISHTL